MVFYSCNKPVDCYSKEQIVQSQRQSLYSQEIANLSRPMCATSLSYHLTVNRCFLASYPICAWLRRQKIDALNIMIMKAFLNTKLIIAPFGTMDAKNALSNMANLPSAKARTYSVARRVSLTASRQRSNPRRPQQILLTTI